MENRNTILVVGQAKPSKEDAIYNLHGEFLYQSDRGAGDWKKFWSWTAIRSM